MNISKDNVPDVIFPRDHSLLGTKHAPESVEIYNAVPGADWIVRNGKNSACNWKQNLELHPRTCVGYTKGKKMLIVVVVDGRQKGFSEGMTIIEMSDLLISLGVYQGISLDGGGSSTLVLATPNPKPVNRPSDGYPKENRERKVANSMAIFAEKTKDKTRSMSVKHHSE